MRKFFIPYHKVRRYDTHSGLGNKIVLTFESVDQIVWIQMKRLLSTFCHGSTCDHSKVMQWTERSALRCCLLYLTRQSLDEIRCLAFEVKHLTCSNLYEANCFSALYILLSFASRPSGVKRFSSCTLSNRSILLLAFHRTSR